MAMPALIDTNVLVYRYDPRFPMKQEIATTVLRDGIMGGDIRVPHQAIVEFVAATSRPRSDGAALLTAPEAHREAEEFLITFPVLYPDEQVVRLALRGAATYGLPWFDAHLWAYAEAFGLDTIITEDFQSDRVYGAVRIHNPFEAGHDDTIRRR